MERISAVIITKNEERNIGRCIESLRGVADEIIVVDSGSTDRTESICRSLGVLFSSHPWEGYAAQKNYADSLAHCEWILSIDADEALSPTLRQNLLALKEQGFDPSCHYSFPRLNIYCGKPIRHCGWYPDRCIRLWPNDGTVRWDGLIHEQLLFSRPLRDCPLHGDLLHYSYYTVSEHIQRISVYAPLSAEKDFRRGKRCSALSLPFRPLWTFLRTYLFKLGFLDGPIGFTICRLSATYTLVKYSTLYLMLHENTH